MTPKQKRMVYIPTIIELPATEDGGSVFRFKLLADGTIYLIKERLVPPKTEFDKAFCQKTQKKPPYKIKKETLYRVKNTQLQQAVFNKYIQDLQKKGALEERFKKEEDNEGSD